MKKNKVKKNKASKENSGFLNKIGRKINDLGGFVKKDLDNNMYKRYKSRDIYRSSLAVLILEVLFYRLMMQQDPALAIYIGMFLMVALFSGFSIYKHSKEKIERVSRDVVNKTFVMLHVLMIFLFFVRIFEN